MSRRPLVAVTVAGVAVVVGTFLPWLRSGARWRTSYELLGVVDRLDIARGAGRTMVRWWPIVPLLVTATVVAAWWSATRLAAALAVFVTAYIVRVGLVLGRSAPRVGLRVGPGPWVTGCAALLLVGAAAWLMVFAVRSGRAPDDSVPSPHADSR